MRNTVEIVTVEDIKNEIRPVLKELGELKSYISLLPPKKYYRNKDLKEVYGLSDNTIKDYRDNNTIPYTQLGTIFYYPVKEIGDILRRNSNYDLVEKVA